MNESTVCPNIEENSNITTTTATNEPPPPYTLLHHKTPITTYQEGYPTYLQPTTPQVLCVTEDILQRLQKVNNKYFFFIIIICN